MRKLSVIFVFALLIFTSSFGTQSLEKIVVFPDSPAFTAEISTNRGTDSEYFPGEDIAVYFKVSSNSFVAIYDILPNGKVSLIFPNRYDQNNFVLAGQLYTLPRAGYRFIVEDITGKEYFQVFASSEQFPGYAMWQKAFANSVFPVESLNADIFFPRYAEKNFPISEIVQIIWTSAITSINILPRPLTGLVSFTSYPTGAQVNIDGEFSGKTTPCILELSAGIHWVDFYISGGNANGQNISVAPGKTISVFHDLFK